MNPKEKLRILIQLGKMPNPKSLGELIRRHSLLKEAGDEQEASA